MKKVFFMIPLLILMISIVPELYAQNGRSGTGIGIEKKGTGVTGQDSGDSDDSFDMDIDTGNDIEVEEGSSGLGNEVLKKKNTAEPKEKTGIAGLSRETLLERETKRHENQMKQVSAIRRRAREMMKKADDMEAKELKRHDESVTKIKNN